MANPDRFKNPSNNYHTDYLSAAFLRGMAFGKSVAAFNGSTAAMSIDNKDDMVLAIKKAYIDMSPRTFEKNANWWKNPNNVKLDKKGKPKDERTQSTEKAWQEAKTRVFTWLAERFEDYFKNGCGDFDKWHEDVCGEFLEKFIPILDTYGYDGAASLKYGKAQKIVNMTFKYLFCFDDAPDYLPKFDACHMPIDSYILNWYHDIIPAKRKTAWSELSKEEYQDIQNNIKSILGDHKPLLAEFYIWAEYNP